MARTFKSLFATAVAALALAGQADARGGDYVFEGGSEAAREQIQAALEASRFNWDLVPRQITIRITRCGCAGARPGVIVLDEDVLVNSRLGPRYAWGLVQDEYAHQVDFFLLGERERASLRRMLGGRDWCYEVRGLMHDDHGCERFSATVAWAYWRSPDNVQTPKWAGGSKLRPAAFRSLLNRLLRTAPTASWQASETATGFGAGADRYSRGRHDPRLRRPSRPPGTRDRGARRRAVLDLRGE